MSAIVFYSWIGSLYRKAEPRLKKVIVGNQMNCQLWLRHDDFSPC